MKGASKAALAKPAPTKISSKQLGDDMTNKKGFERGPPLLNSAGNSFKDDKQSQPMTSYANDAIRVWPLFCYEQQFCPAEQNIFFLWA